MHFLCSLRLDNGFAAGAEFPLRVTLAANGWEVREAGFYLFSVPAEPGAVDGPSLTLGAALRAITLREKPEENALPATLACAYRDAVVFSERIAVFPLPGGGAGMCAEPGVQPLFVDSIRLRDAMIAALSRVHPRR